MDLTNEIKALIGRPESEELEYKAILPPSRHIAKLISAFANTQGGYIILGVVEEGSSIKIAGLSQDFHAHSILQKAINELDVKPIFYSQYIEIDGRKIFAIKIEKSPQTVSIGGEYFLRKGNDVVSNTPNQQIIPITNFPYLSEVNSLLNSYKTNATNSKLNVIEHYQSVLNLVKEFSAKLFPTNPDIAPTEQEGRILIRILFSSVVDNFETYLSDLLYEIFLGIPSTLKNNQQVTIEEVLNCSDMQEFIQYWAKKKINKLQKGSVKGFVKDNKQIGDLKVLDDVKVEKIEKILQIRHLYSHRNGIVDEQFLLHFTGQFVLHTEHKMSAKDFLSKIEYLSAAINDIDIAAVKKYQLATI
jgi:hypothetical protein